MRSKPSLVILTRSLRQTSQRRTSFENDDTIKYICPFAGVKASFVIPFPRHTLSQVSFGAWHICWSEMSGNLRWCNFPLTHYFKAHSPLEWGGSSVRDHRKALWRHGEGKCHAITVRTLPSIKRPEVHYGDSQWEGALPEWGAYRWSWVISRGLKAEARYLILWSPDTDWQPSCL